jgi:hypothetical protein
MESALAKPEWGGYTRGPDRGKHMSEEQPSPRDILATLRERAARMREEHAARMQDAVAAPRQADDPGTPIKRWMVVYSAFDHMFDPPVSYCGFLPVYAPDKSVAEAMGEMMRPGIWVHESSGRRVPLNLRVAQMTSGVREALDNDDGEHGAVETTAEYPAIPWHQD